MSCRKMYRKGNIVVKLDYIATEESNEVSFNIDTLAVEDMVRLMNDEDKKVAEAVSKVIPQIAEASLTIYQQLKKGGRLIYIGCGTSGRLGVLDAVECPPTFGTDPEMVQAIIAGGENAFVKAKEGAEDDREAGKADLEARQFCGKDVLVGIAASGRTPYVLGAMEYARQVKAPVIGLTCCPASEMERLADIAIVLEPGPEIIAGSTRLKSGTAEKMVLNMLSTTVMIQMGKVYGNQMVDVKASNEKLVERAVRIVRNVTGTDGVTARETLKECDYSAKTAIVMILTKADRRTAEELLNQNEGRIRAIIENTEDAEDKEDVKHMAYTENMTDSEDAADTEDFDERGVLCG